MRPAPGPIARPTLRVFGAANPIECYVNVNATRAFISAARDGTVFAMPRTRLLRLSQCGAAVSIVLRLCHPFATADRVDHQRADHTVPTRGSRVAARAAGRADRCRAWRRCHDG